MSTAQTERVGVDATREAPTVTLERRHPRDLRLSARDRARFALRSRPAVSALFGLITATVCAIGSWVPSLWGDEAASLTSATRPIATLWPMLTQVDAVQGTYYLFLRAWLHLVGYTPFSIRFPDAIAAGLAVAGIVWLADVAADRKLAVITGIVAVILPRVTYMGEEARSYAFSAAIAAWLCVLAWQMLRGRSSRALGVAYVALLLFGTYLFLYTFLIAVAQIIALMILRRRNVARRIARLAALCAVCTVPLLVIAYLERSQIAYLKTSGPFTVDAVFVGQWFSTWWFAAPAWALIIVAIAAGVRAGMRARAGARSRVSAGSLPDGAPPRREQTSQQALLVLGVCWLVLPAAVLIAMQTVIAGYTSRYLSDCAPAAALVIALGIRALSHRGVVRALMHLRPFARRRYSEAGAMRRVRLVGRWPWIATAAALVVLITAAAPIYVSQRTPYAKNGADWASISSTMGRIASPGAAVIFDASVSPTHRPRLALATYPAGFRGLTDVLLDTPLAQRTTWYDSTIPIASATAKTRISAFQTVWLIDWASGSTADDWGQATLRADGYTGVLRASTYSSRIYEFTKTTR